jgi:hypothetical protein
MKAIASLLLSLAVLAGAAPPPAPAPVVLQVSAFQLGIAGKHEVRTVMRSDATWERLVASPGRPEGTVIAWGTAGGRFRAWARRVDAFRLKPGGESYGEAKSAGVNEHWIVVSSPSGWLEARGLPPNRGIVPASAELRDAGLGGRVDAAAALVAEMERLMETGPTP